MAAALRNQRELSYEDVWAFVMPVLGTGVGDGKFSLLCRDQ